MSACSSYLHYILSAKIHEKVTSISFCLGLCIIIASISKFCTFPEDSLVIIKCHMLIGGNYEGFLIGLFFEMYNSLTWYTSLVWKLVKSVPWFHS